MIKSQASPLFFKAVLLLFSFTACTNLFAAEKTAPVSAALSVSHFKRSLDPTRCKTSENGPIATIRDELLEYREALSESAFTDRINALLALEIKNGKDQPELNWFRAVNPFLLPDDFPTVVGFSRCAAYLRNFADSRLQSEIDEWKSCVRTLYRKGRPSEFDTLEKCLVVAPTKAPPPTTDSVSDPQ